MGNRSVIFLALISGAVAWGQSANAFPSFEVASIKPSPPPDGQGFTQGCRSDPGRITCTHITATNLFEMAYRIDSFQLSGIGTNLGRFEIAVTVPAGATKEQIQLMWRNLLTDRFKLAVHREPKKVPTYELVVAKGGPKMKESVDSDPSPPPQADLPPTLGKDGFPDLPPGVGMAIMRNKARWRATKVTAESIAAFLATQLRQPVTDATGLKRNYDFTLSWVSVEPPVGDASESDGPTLFSAVQNQLGLKLEPKTGSVEMLVVDHIEKPTEN
jgi:uncharacterized protein (TIGR03435 family)